MALGLLKLSTLLGVSVQSCRKDVLEWLPNLKRLGIRIELKPHDEGKSLHYLNNIHYLRRLKSLKCVVVNPRMGSKVIALPAPISMFPASLRKLSLSGTGYAWEHMSIIGMLGNLEVLKLKCYAFQGPKWDMSYTSQFEKLKCLLVEDTNLEKWKVNSEIAMKLQRLHIKHCYKLRELPLGMHISNLGKMKIEDCSSSIVAWAQQVKLIVDRCELSVHRSWFANSVI